MIISGCNFAAKFLFFKKKLQPFPQKNPYTSSFELVMVSGCLKKKQEVDFDLLSR